MHRRGLCTSLWALPVSMLTTWPIPRVQDHDGTKAREADTKAALEPSGPLVSSADGQIFENLDVVALSGVSIQVSHRGVTIRNCRIRHAGGHGVQGEDAPGLVLQDLEIIRVNRTESDNRPREFLNNINLDRCAGASIRRIKASRGSSNMYIRNSEGVRLSHLELHDACGPFPRGQNVQLHDSPNSLLEDFSGENSPSSWTEDNVSIFHSDGCTVRRGLVAYNNSPTGDGVMIEGSFNCLVEDVDAVQQGNGAFAAVPEGDVGCGGCTFRRCRTRASYNKSRDGRARPSSNSLSFYMQISKGAQKHKIIDCHYDALANPGNLIWDTRCVADDWSFTPQEFTPRSPIRLSFGWHQQKIPQPT